MKAYLEGKPNTMNKWKLERLKNIGFIWYVFLLSCCREISSLFVCWFVRSFFMIYIISSRLPINDISICTNNSLPCFCFFSFWYPLNLHLRYVHVRAKPRGQSCWQHRYDELLEFKKIHGHCKFLLQFAIFA